LLRALGTKNEARYNLKIVDVDRPESERGTSASSTSGSDSNDTTDDGTSVSSKVQDPTTDDEDDTDTESATPSNDAVARTRKELAELDDLDI